MPTFGQILAIAIIAAADLDFEGLAGGPLAARSEQLGERVSEDARPLLELTVCGRDEPAGAAAAPHLVVADRLRDERRPEIHRRAEPRIVRGIGDSELERVPADDSSRLDERLAAVRLDDGVVQPTVLLRQGVAQMFHTRLFLLGRGAEPPRGRARASRRPRGSRCIRRGPP